MGKSALGPLKANEEARQSLTLQKQREKKKCKTVARGSASNNTTTSDLRCNNIMRK